MAGHEGRRNRHQGTTKAVAPAKEQSALRTRRSKHQNWAHSPPDDDAYKCPSGRKTSFVSHNSHFWMIRDDEHCRISLCPKINATRPQMRAAKLFVVNPRPKRLAKQAKRAKEGPSADEPYPSRAVQARAGFFFWALSNFGRHVFRLSALWTSCSRHAAKEPGTGSSELEP